MKGKGCGCKSMRNGGTCMRCGGKAKYNFGGLVKKYADGGDVEPVKPITKEDAAFIKEVKDYYKDWGGPMTLKKYGSELQSRLGAYNPLNIATQAVLVNNEGNVVVEGDNTGKFKRGATLVGNKSTGYDVNAKLQGSEKTRQESNPIYDYFSGNLSDDEFFAKASAMTSDLSGNTASGASGTNTMPESKGTAGLPESKGIAGLVPASGTGTEKTPVTTTTGTGGMKEDRSLPNWGRLKGEQTKINQLIQNDASADKPKLLATDDVYGDMTRDAMDYYEKKGMYKRPALFSKDNIEQYKKNAAAGIGIGGGTVKTVQGGKEQAATGNKGKGAVQITQDAIAQFKKAYPNYPADKIEEGIASGKLEKFSTKTNGVTREGIRINATYEEPQAGSFKDIWGKPTGEKQALNPISEGTILDDVYAQHEASAKKALTSKVGISEKEAASMSPEAMDALKRTTESQAKPYFGYAGEETMPAQPKKETTQVKPKFGSIKDVMSGVGSLTGQGLDAIKGGFQSGMDMIAQLPKKPLPQSKEGILGEIREIRGVLDRMYSSESSMDEALVNKLIERKSKLESMYGGPIPEYNEPVSNNPLGDEVRAESAKIKSDIDKEFESFEKEFRKKMFKEGTDLNSLSPEVRSRYNQKLNEAYMKYAAKKKGTKK